MSALTFTLIFFLCVCCSIIKINGIQNLRYPTRVEHKQWRFGNRQDQQPRFFLWKSTLTPGHIYSNAKTPVLPLNYNRYGIPPAMPPLHQSYMFAIPTKMNYHPYQSLKENEEKRKPGNLHHITIINAIIPKPYMPTPPTYSHPTTTFQNYRNNKMLYHQYLNNNYGRQNLENFNKYKTQQQQQQQQLQNQQLQYQKQQKPMVFESPQNTLPAPLMVNNKPTMEYINLISYNANNNNNNHENKINNATIPNCSRKSKDDSTNSANNVLYYYCNNRILDYKNPSENYIESTQPITTSTPKTTTTSIKSSRLDLGFYTTEKPVFLPTPNAPLKTSSDTFVFTTPRKIHENEYNFLPTRSTYDMKYDGIELQQQRHTTKIYDDLKPQQQQQRHTTATYDEMKRQQLRHTSTKYDDIKRPQQQRYTTSSSLYDDVKLHSFFTIEDAVTKAPQMHVFNDPYQAYRHARKHHHYHQRQTTTTTTKKPIATTTTKKSIFKSFFDDLDDEDYVTPESHQYDYSFFGQSQKSVNQKAKNENDFKLPTTHNQIVDHTHKPDVGDSLFDESYQGKPKINEHHFGIFDAIVPSTYIAPTNQKAKNENDLSNQIADHAHKADVGDSLFDESYQGKPKIKEHHFDIFDAIAPSTYIAPTNQKAKNENILKLPKHNQIVDHTHKPDVADSLFDESYQGKPKIKEHHFGIFDAIAPSHYIAPTNTTINPSEILNDISYTTQSYKSKPVTYSTTTELRLGNMEQETTTPEVGTTTTLATRTKTEKNSKRMPTKTPLKLRSTASFKYPKHRGLYKPIKNITTSTSSTTTPSFKKITKYQRQYKGKKMKQFNHLFTTSSSTITTTTTIAPKIEEYHTKRTPSRTFPNTSTTETATTRRIISKTSATTETTNPRKVSSRFTSTVETNNAKKPSSRIVSSTEANSTMKKSLRRGHKRGNKPQAKEEPPIDNTKRTQNNRRRRPQTTSTTTKLPNLPTTSTSPSPTSATTSSRTPSTTTMKSIMRIANSKSRSQVQNEIKPIVKLSNEVYDDSLTSDNRVSLKSITSSMAKDVTVPSLPIEIYFKKSQIAKI